VATKLFLRTVSSGGRDYGTANNDANLRGTGIGWDSAMLATTAGPTNTNSASVATVAGATPGVEIASSNAALVWYSSPLAAAATISGSITWNIWAAESSLSANVAINGRIEVVDGATGAITLINQTTRTTELTLTSVATNFAQTPAAGVACKKGDRLRVRLFGDDAGTMATGFTFNVSYSGPTAAAAGDTWLQLTETLSFVSEPAGTQVFPTDDASAVSTASVDREAWTSRGAGVQTDVTNTVAGWTAPIQVTDTAGGTVVDWFTRPLTAFTLGQAARVNVRGAESAAFPLVSLRCEIAVTAGDGTAASVWATGGNVAELGTSESAQSFLIAGDDRAVTNGQRLRIRFSIDDRGVSAMAAAGTATLFYAGAAGATGDTFLTFTQALTELVVPPGPHVSPYPQILAH
jgi:hypothetical protein